MYPLELIVDSIMVVGALTCCTLFHSECDLKTAQMNVQRGLIRERILYKFKRGHNAAEATKKICCAKSKGAVDHSTVTRWLKYFTRVAKTSTIAQLAGAVEYTDCFSADG